MTQEKLEQYYQRPLYKWSLVSLSLALCKHFLGVNYVKRFSSEIMTEGSKYTVENYNRYYYTICIEVDLNRDLKTRYGIGICEYCVIPRPGCSHTLHTNSSNGNSLLKLVGDFKTKPTSVPIF